MTASHGITRNLTLAGFSVLLICCAMTSCQSSQPNRSAGMFSSAPKASANSAANDYTKPYLTDEKMQKFIASMKEEHNPLELVFKQGGQMQNPVTLGERLDEFNSFARRYGFQDYQDYSAVWGRILAGEMQLWAADMMQESKKSLEAMIANTQAELKKPNLTPEMRKLDEEQIASTQKALDDMNKNSGKETVNAADMELVKKYKDQIDAAEKKYKSGVTANAK